MNCTVSLMDYYLNGMEKHYLDKEFEFINKQEVHEPHGSPEQQWLYTVVQRIMCYIAPR